MELSDDDRNAVVRTIMDLRARGITDRRLLSALERIPRQTFVPEGMDCAVYSNRALPLGFGQSMTQPLLAGLIVGALRVGDTDKVLEVGTGSGYQAALLARLARRVYSIERIRPFVRRAETNLSTLTITNVSVMYGDGLLGWMPQAPFARIVLNGAVTEVPDVLTDQLADGGILIAPVGAETDNQILTQIVRGPSGMESTALAHVKFAALIPGKSPEV